MGSFFSKPRSEQTIDLSEEAIERRNQQFIDELIGKPLDSVSFKSLSVLGYYGVIVRPNDPVREVTQNCLLVYVDENETVVQIVHKSSV